ncbi:hypothetical protein B566_EDAN012942 [Ephemera danica]|nr:hypothetical protein B566_EDAN012942 [Ephemera danica]
MDRIPTDPFKFHTFRIHRKSQNCGENFIGNMHEIDKFSVELARLMVLICAVSQFVPDDLKDEKYWARRRKNNLAAKRSRDARRVKENQIALRAGFLEKEGVCTRNFNLTLKQEVERLKKENISLRSKLEKSAPKSN